MIDTDDENEGSATPVVFTNENKNIKQFTQVVPFNIHYFYITDEIEEIHPYLQLVNVLRTSDANTNIYINLSSPGGSLYTSVQIINAMRDSQATVITVLDGLVASAASLILLSGHKILINKNSSLMIHNYSQSISTSKSNELMLHVEYQRRYFKQLAEDIYGDFLTKTEIHEMLNNGRDYWFTSDEVINRLNKKNKIFKEETSIVKKSNKK